MPPPNPITDLSDLPRTRAEATRLGLKHFFTGERCNHGHLARRYTKNGICERCAREASDRHRRKAGTAGTAIAVVKPINGDWRFYANKIAAAWQRAVESIIETGALLIEAKKKIPHSQFEQMVESKLPFGPRTAQMLMAIAGNPVIANTNHGSLLPPSWRTLYELTKLPNRVLLAKIDDHTITPDMERKDVTDIAASLSEEDKQEAKAEKRDSKPTKPAHITINTDETNEQMAEKIVGLLGEMRSFQVTKEMDKLIKARAIMTINFSN